MSPSELAAFNSGIRHAADMALVVAVTIETRTGTEHIRQRAAVEALRGLADGLKGVAFQHPPAVLSANETGTHSLQEKGPHSVRTPVIPGSGENSRSSDLRSGKGVHSPHTLGRLPSEGGIVSLPPYSAGDVTTTSIASRDEALAAGFTGDACNRCGSFAMKRAGTCQACQACGSTTGCS